MKSSDTKELFKRLNIKTILDLALILPKSYEDTLLEKEIINNKIQTFEAIVKGRRFIDKKMQIDFYLPSLNRELKGYIFYLTPYHIELFKEGSKHIIRGRVLLFRGLATIAQPKSIKEWGKIIPRYKVAIKEAQFKTLISTYINRATLAKEGLNKKEIDTLLDLHFPNKIPNLKDKNTLEALKSIEALNHLKKLRAKRREYPALKALNGDIVPFLKSLPFELTKSQERAINQIVKDLSQDRRSARRLIIGDVGSGKTMVILASAMVAYKDKSILMAPTSILARQIYEEAKRYLSPFLKIALFSQNQRIGDYKEADFIIATHAILYLEKLPDAKLIMVDEQHRFGANQRALLESLLSRGDKRPHYLQFSATPIPRTQAMIESELIDISLIDELPFKRDVTSKVITRGDFKNLIAHIESEIAKNHQILIVYPLVEQSSEIPYQGINEAKGFWQKRYKSVFVTYGKDKNKEQTLLEFKERGSILLATTVIEVGVSLPRLTTVVIVGAERLGLATLHQLRGRVGRNGLKSWCFLYTNKPDDKRLKLFCKYKSGFEIAKLDLLFRDSGDIIDGKAQSGQSFKWLNLAKDEAIIKSVKERLELLSRVN